MPKAAKDKYTNVELRDEIKQELMDGDKGGKPGQWSARKAQMMASEYKRRGGEYKGEKDDTQQHLTNWTEEEWQTKEESANAKKADGTEKRYLPKAAWDKMSEGEKQETEEAKAQGQKAGDQYVENPPAAKMARKRAAKDIEESEASEQEDEAAEESEEDKPPPPKAAKTKKAPKNGEEKPIRAQPKRGQAAAAAKSASKAKASDKGKK